MPDSVALAIGTERGPINVDGVGQWRVGEAVLEEWLARHEGRRAVMTTRDDPKGAFLVIQVQEHQG